MDLSNPLMRRQPLGSLAAKIIFVVCLATFLTALVVSGISVHSTHGFLKRQIDESYPALLARTAERIESRLREGRSELERLSVDPALLRAASLSNRSRAVEERLREALAEMSSFDALALIDSAGETVAVAGAGKSLPSFTPLAQRGGGDEGAAVAAIPDDANTALPVAWIRLVQGRDRVLGTLCGIFRRGELRHMLAARGIGAGGVVYLVSGTRPPGLKRLVAASQAGRPSASLLELTPGEVHRYRSRSGRRMVGATRSLDTLDWTLIVEQPFENAFAPLYLVLTRLLVIDLCIILLFGFVAYQVTATVVQPIEALSHGARRISQGELDVQIAGTHASDEIGLLIRTFNDMTRKLLQQRTEIQQVNHKLLAQNDELQRANEVLEQLSITDGLTKLHNHRFFQEHLTREIKRADRSEEPLSLLLLDIDDFKQLNDQFGHVAGDELLVGLAQVLNQSMRDSDLIARYGGEEFAVLAANTELAGAVNLGEKIRTAVAESAFIVGDSMRPLRMTISIGVAQYRGSRKQLFREADRALYRAKAEGKNCVVAEDPDAPDLPPPTFLRET